MSDAHARERTNAEAGTQAPGLRVPFSARAVAPPGPAARRRLALVVGIKLTLDLLFVCALALYAYADTFRNTFKGALERADARAVSGWAADESRPGEFVEVQLFVDGRFVAARLADGPRADVDSWKVSEDAGHGFVFEFEPPLAGAHEARVYAVRAGRGGSRLTLQQVGAPRAFDAR
jgi:hypothetical protein